MKTPVKQTSSALRFKPVHVVEQSDQPFLCGSAFKELIRSVLKKGLSIKFVAHGFSMAPFIKNGDTLTVGPMHNTAPGMGDIVAYIHTETEKIVVHRIVKRNGKDCLIKGDNALEADGFIPQTSILGYVSKVEREGKEVKLGLGPERRLIALLIRSGLHIALLLPVWRLLRPFIQGETFEK